MSKFTSGITEIDRTAEAGLYDFTEFSLSEPIKLAGKIVIENSGQIWLAATLTAKVHQKCDRCLTDYIEVIKKEINLTLSKDVKEERQESEYDLFPDDSDIADLTKYIKDTVTIAMPNKSLCKPDCNGLCPQCGQNLNEEECDCETEDFDPRLEKLKELKNKMED